MPDPLHEEGTELYQIPGLPPDVVHMPTNQCPFAERCYRAEDICRREFPPFVQLNAEHFSLCHFAEEVYAGSRAEADGRAGAGAPGRTSDKEGPADG
ncbi:MAG: hypothetical protein DMF65_06535 [Acidobacteria bacterium]|nr:MAG: hypothetical protein DMF65_06535 [Acidobacteriota bacterium]